MKSLMRIENVNVYGLRESILASGYPMSVESKDFDSTEIGEADLRRATRLGTAVPASGHDCMLKGIVVQMDLTISQALSQQIKRYHFIDIVSSTSTMHRITKMNISKQCNPYVAAPTISMLKHLVTIYNQWDFNYEHNLLDSYVTDIFTMYGIEVATKSELFEAIVYNIPSGFCLTARWTTNYLQLKTIYNQRKHHKLSEWKELCDWMLTLPHFKEFCIK